MGSALNILRRWPRPNDEPPINICYSLTSQNISCSDGKLCVYLTLEIKLLECIYNIFIVLFSFVMYRYIKYIEEW